MKLGNTLAAYSPEEIEAMGTRIAEYLESLKEVAALVNAQLMNPEPPDENIIYIDNHPFTEYDKLLDAVMDFHDILAVYEKWSETLWQLAHLNLGQYHNPKVMGYIVKMHFMVGSFQNFFNTGAKPPLPPTPSGS